MTNDEFNLKDNLFSQILFNKNEFEVMSGEKPQLLVHAFILDLKLNNFDDFRAFEKFLESEKRRLARDIAQLIIDAVDLEEKTPGLPRRAADSQIADFAGHVQVLINVTARIEEIYKSLAGTSVKAAKDLDTNGVSGYSRFDEVSKTMQESADGMGEYFIRLKALENNVQTLLIIAESNAITTPARADEQPAARSQYRPSTTTQAPQR